MRVSHRSTAARIVSSSRSASRMIMTSYGRNASAIRPGLLRTTARAAGPRGLGRNAWPEGQDARLSNREKVSDHLVRPIESDPTHRVRQFPLPTPLVALSSTTRGHRAGAERARRRLEREAVRVVAAVHGAFVGGAG